MLFPPYSSHQTLNPAPLPFNSLLFHTSQPFLLFNEFPRSLHPKHPIAYLNLPPFYPYFPIAYPSLTSLSSFQQLSFSDYPPIRAIPFPFFSTLPHNQSTHPTLNSTLHSQHFLGFNPQKTAAISINQRFLLSPFLSCFPRFLPRIHPP